MLEWENFLLEPREGLRLGGKTAGSGPRLLLVLPGFGNDRHWFDGLLTQLPPGWRLACFDLPPFYEGTWAPDRPIDAPALKAWLHAAATHFAATELHLMAFSLGARVALGMYGADPARIRSLFLFSPDGLKVNPFYAFAMYTRLGNALFRRILRKPARFLRIVRILYRLRLLGATIYRLAMAQFESEARRERLRKAWEMWSGIRPDIRQLAADSATHSTTWHVLWGKADEILPPRLGKRFCSKVPGAKLHLVPGGHFMIRNPRPELAALVFKLLETV